ncbi:MAG: DUF1579 domain-containing protein [Tahibacter sp.]
MKLPVAICTMLLALSGVTAVHADDKGKAPSPAMSAEQKAMMDAYARVGEVRAEQKQLAYFVGNWKTETSMWMDPKAAPEKSAGSSKGESMYEGRYYRLQHQGMAMGQTFSGEGMLGYDNLKGKFYNTWIDSMSTGFWLALGSYDAATKTYTFNGDMDDAMKAGAKIPIREVVKIVDKDHYTFEWFETREGKEARTMQISYVRQ